MCCAWQCVKAQPIWCGPPNDIISIHFMFKRKMKTTFISLIWKLFVSERLLKDIQGTYGYIWKATHLQRFQSLSPQILKATDQFTPFKAKHRLLRAISVPRGPMYCGIKRQCGLKKRSYALEHMHILWISVQWFHTSNIHCVNHWAHQTAWNQIISVPALLTQSPKPAGTQQGQLAMLIPQQPAQTQTIISNRVSHRVCLHCTGQRRCMLHCRLWCFALLFT